jgi:hypothetical protein
MVDLRTGGADIDEEIADLKARVAVLEASDADQDRRLAALEGGDVTPPIPPIEPPITGGNTMENGWALSSSFPGSDLGQQINAAFDAGHQAVEVPYAKNHVIRTTIKLRHACTVKFAASYPGHIVCQTNNKPVFEVLGSQRHWRILGGIFDGASTGTPSCFLLCGRVDDHAATPGGGQCGDIGLVSGVMASGHWGYGPVINIGAEITTFENCNLWIQGRGDRVPSNHPGAAVTIANADYWNVPFAYNKPNRKSASTSANVFQNCDIRGGAGGSMAVLLKGQVEDVSVYGSYLNGTGRCHVLIEPGTDANGYKTSPRRLLIAGGGRSECNGMAAGCPLVLVDGMDQGGQLHLLTIGPFGIFVGAQATTTPVIKTERGGLIHALTVNQGCHIEWSSVLVDHRTADLNWASIRSHFNVEVNVEGRSINDSDIWIKGNVKGNVAASSRVRSANQNKG